MILLFAGVFGLTQISNTFAAGVALNSGNVTDYCARNANDCNFSPGITSIAPGTFSGYRLISLGLGANQITSLESGAFN
jgi:hypothetical protein